MIATSLSTQLKNLLYISAMDKKPAADPKNELKRCLMGVLETCTFLKRGPSKFGHTYGEALRSFILIPALFPINLLALYLVWDSNEPLKAHPFYTFAFAYTESVFFMIVSLLLSFYGFCIMKNKNHLYLRFVSGMNWIGIFPALLYLFPLLSVFWNFHTLSDVSGLTTLLTLYEFSMIGFFIAYALEVRWYVAAPLSFFIFCFQNIGLENAVMSLGG